MASFLDTLFGGGAEKDAANANRSLLTDYLNKGTSALDSGLTSSTSYLNSAGTTLSDLQKKYGAGTDLYLNALGVNGADAAQQAQQSFTNGPGYQQGINAGLDAINRRRAAGGMLDSGNADLDALNFAQNNQNQQYNTWLSNLGGLVSPEAQAATGVANNDTNLANLYSTDATNRIGLYGNYASGNIGANNMQAAGESAGAKNLLGGALSLAGLGLKASGIGGFGSALKV
jgi:hypothetical protein